MHQRVKLSTNFLSWVVYLEANCVVCSVLRFFDSVNNLCLIGFFLNSRNQRTFGSSFLKISRITQHLVPHFFKKNFRITEPLDPSFGEPPVKGQNQFFNLWQPLIKGENQFSDFWEQPVNGPYTWSLLSGSSFEIQRTTQHC